MNIATETIRDWATTCAVNTSNGKAEAITIESNALRANPQILELRALEKWNGVLPQVTSGAVPFINLPK